MRFKQLRLNYINSKKKKKKKKKKKEERLVIITINNNNNKRLIIRLVISSIRVDVVAKTDDEVYVSNTIKMYSYFLFFPYCPKYGPVDENIETDVATSKIITTMQKW